MTSYHMSIMQMTRSGHQMFPLFLFPPKQFREKKSSRNRKIAGFCTVYEVLQNILRFKNNMSITQITVLVNPTQHCQISPHRRFFIYTRDITTSRSRFDLKMIEFLFIEMSTSDYGRLKKWPRGMRTSIQLINKNNVCCL